MLPPFPQNPRTLTVRQLECIRCREVFTIAEDSPNRLTSRTRLWQVPQDQYPLTPLRYVETREQVGIIPEVRAQPIQQVSANRDWGQNYHLNCPRCGADNRNWLFVSSRIRPLFTLPVIVGIGISILLCMLIVGSQWLELFQDRLLALLCLTLAAILPFVLVPGQWFALREYHLARRFLPMLTQHRFTPPIRTVVVLYLLLIITIPGIRYAAKPVLNQTLTFAIESLSNDLATSRVNTVEEKVKDDLEFFLEWLYLGTIVSIVSSVFAVLSVEHVVARINNQLPRPIYANTANMVRVTLWEAKRALEIRDFFERIQWTMTKRNEQGGIDMEGYFRDPPEFLSNGELSDFVKVQKYEISTDRWCTIVSAKIIDTKRLRPAGGLYYAVPIPPKLPTPNISVGRNMY